MTAILPSIVICCYSGYAQDGIRNIALPTLPVAVVIASLVIGIIFIGGLGTVLPDLQELLFGAPRG